MIFIEFFMVSIILKEISNVTGYIRNRIILSKYAQNLLFVARQIFFKLKQKMKFGTKQFKKINFVHFTIKKIVETQSSTYSC